MVGIVAVVVVDVAIVEIDVPRVTGITSAERTLCNFATHPWG
jgi:hypothetical protein